MVVVEEGELGGFQMNFEVQPKGLAARLDVGSERKQSQDFWPEEEGGSSLAS